LGVKLIATRWYTLVFQAQTEKQKRAALASKQPFVTLDSEPAHNKTPLGRGIINKGKGKPFPKLAKLQKNKDAGVPPGPGLSSNNSKTS